MAGMKALRDKAKQAGVPVKEIRAAESSAELKKLIAQASNGSGTKARGKRVVKKATKASKAVAKRGRPAKKATTRKATTRKASASTSNGNKGGRNTLGNVKFSKTDGWNPREGSVPDVIVKALRKAKGNREQAYKALLPKIDKLVPKRTRQGRTRNKSERQDYLRYLISRNAWAFAMATGQHTESKNRVEYGTGGTGEGKFKRAGSRKSASKGTQKASRGRGRPKGSTTKAKATKRSGGRAAAKKAGRKAARKR